MQINKTRGIREKILKLILTSTIIIFLVTISVISITHRKASLKDAFTLTDTYSNQYANEVKAYLEEYMDVSRALSSIFEGKDSYPLRTRRQIFMNMLRDVLVDNSHFLAAWTIWEPNAVDGLDSLYVLKPGCTYIGSFSTTYYRDNEQIKLENSGVEGELFVGGYYTVPKSTKKETLLNPFIYSYTGDPEDEILQTNMIVPIISNQTFLGVVGIDAALGSFKEIIDKIRPFQNGYAFILANNGSFVAHPNMENIGINYADFAQEQNIKYKVVKKVAQGEPFSFIHKDENDTYYYSFTPITVGNSKTPWSLAVVVPHKSVLATVNRDILISLFIGFIGLIILAIISNLVSGKISKPLMEISDEMQKLNAADVKKLNAIAQAEKNEIGNIAKLSHSLIDWINRTGDFVKSIGEKNFEYKYELYNENDLLGKSLLEMREALIIAQAEAKLRDIENEKRTWAAQGSSKINEVIRANNDDIENLYYNIVSTLVQYIDANQAGIFIMETDENNDEILKLKASYAYSRRKFLKKKQYANEGILGECIMGKEPILLSEVPEGYVEIVSGLGGSNPKFVLVVPLLFNEKVYGVIEVASFNKIENHVHEFVESVGETVASTISMINTNMQTTKLLEMSQQQAQELETRENELHQNLEELTSVHDQMDITNKKVAEREQNLVSIFDGIKDGLLTCTEEGAIVDINPEFISFTGHDESLKGSLIFDLMEIDKLGDLKLQEQTINIIKKDNTRLETKVKISKINAEGGVNYLFLVRT